MTAAREPWQVFHDELRRQIADLDDVDLGPGGPTKRVSEADIPGMSTAVANRVMAHLAEERGLGPDQALEVTKLFFAELARPSSEPLAERLKRVWEGWRDG